MVVLVVMVVVFRLRVSLPQTTECFSYLRRMLKYVPLEMLPHFVTVGCTRPERVQPVCTMLVAPLAALAGLMSPLTRRIAPPF